MGRPDNSGTTNPNPTPGTVDRPADAPDTSLDFSWIRVSADGNHSIAGGAYDYRGACDFGNVFTWGLNRFGQLGRDVNTGTWNPNPTPGAVAEPAQPADTRFLWRKVISAGTNHSTAEGYSSSSSYSFDCYSWGSNGYGQLGRATGNGGNDYTPTPGIMATPAGATGNFWYIGSGVLGGGGHSMAVGSDGNLYTWGDNRAG